MAISPPAERIWWHQPIQREELIWIIVAFLWGLVMFFMMIYWHAFGQQNLSNEAYRVTPEVFAAKTQAMIDKYQVRDDNGFPVVRPPAGSDVYLMGRVWMWYPHLELEKGQSYRLHLSSMDYAARLLAAAGQHQPAGASRLRDGPHNHAERVRRVWRRVQRVLRPRPSHDGRQDLRGRP